MGLYLFPFWLPVGKLRASHLPRHSVTSLIYFLTRPLQMIVVVANAIAVRKGSKESCNCGLTGALDAFNANTEIAETYPVN